MKEITGDGYTTGGAAPGGRWDGLESWADLGTWRIEPDGPAYHADTPAYPAWYIMVAIWQPRGAGAAMGQHDENGDGQRACARGDWCSGRTISVQDGERTITPAFTYRAYCDPCEAHIAGLLLPDPADPARGFGALYRRLAGAIGDAQQADVQVHAPFGPQTPLREDVDACMRLTADRLRRWAMRTRGTARLAPAAHGQGTPEGVAEDAATLGAHITVLLALQPGWMRRTFRLPLTDELAAWLADDEIFQVTDHDITVMTEAGGEDAGQEILHLHYLGRRCLLETNPPPEILIVPCRKCTHRALRRAWPDGERDLYSRCERCGDELTMQEYDVNALRWVAYEKAHASGRPVLGQPENAVA